ncbi:MAG: hypothetical protein J7604_07270 [Sporocytophaga sp.]|uniref:hypothetical protein n=1 Tax=Sporocytophaga sp. TaxID=2231183 RepID=UPI001B0C2A8D|nr:hypothetical protein [Sporocytophaga sp.]MBO9699994.1 hypothetical protein [Sporocytophaga sp.]
MNKIHLQIIFTLLVLGACSSTNEEKDNHQKLNKEKITAMVAYIIPKECGKIDLKGFNSDSLFINYANYLNGLDCHKPMSIGLAKKELSLIITKCDTIKADSLFFIFNKYYDLVTDSLNSVLEHDTTDYTPFVTISRQKAPEKRAKTYYNELRRNGFNFNYPEGIIEIEQDRDFIKREFYHILSHRMIEYLDQVNYENKNWFENDASILLTEKDFLERLLWWEKFNNTNPEFLFSKEGKNNERYYLYFLLNGMDNTYPFMDEGKLVEYFKNLYELADNYPVETECIKVIRKQYEMIKQSGMKDSEERQDFLKELQRENKIYSFD